LTRVAELVDKSKKEQDNKEALRKLEASLDGYSLKVCFAQEIRHREPIEKPTPLQEPLDAGPRLLVKEGLLMKYNKQLKCQTRYFVLTTDMLIYAKEKSLGFPLGKRYVRLIH
jgi:hypothetical protein